MYQTFNNITTGSVEDIIGKKVNVSVETVYGEKRIKNITPAGWKKLYGFLKCYINKTEETFRYIILDTNGIIRHQLSICCHIPNFCRVTDKDDKTLKEVISLLHRDNLYLVICHNHPSGCSTQSTFDKELTVSFTKSLKRNDGKQSFLGHIIICENEYSFCNKGCRWKMEKVVTTAVADSEKKFFWDTYINGTSSLGELSQKFSNKQYSVVFTNAERRTVALQYVKPDFIEKTSEVIREELKKLARKVGAIGAFLCVPRQVILSENQLVLIKSHIENDAFTDCGHKGMTFCDKFDLEAGRSLFTSSDQLEKMDIKSTWDRFINKHLFP